MESALIISYSDKGSEVIFNVLKTMSFKKIATAKTCGEARRLCTELNFDLYIINSPVYNESGEDLARELVAVGANQVIVLAKNDIYEYMASRLESHGVITVQKPINKELLSMSVKLSRAVFARINNMQKITTKLTKKIEDIRVIDRAKCVLISHLSMSEEQAHKHIEKKAMDTRQSKRQVAQNILKVYES